MRIVAALLLAATTAHAGYSCVDPADATARRRIQDEPCRLPMYQWPLPESPKIVEPPRGAKVQPGAQATEPAPEFFWRLPRHGYPPHSAPSAGPWPPWR